MQWWYFLFLSRVARLCVLPQAVMTMRNFPWSSWKIDRAHDEGMGISKSNPAQMALLVLEDGKVLKFSRKASPSENCINLGQPCGALDHCCDPYYCSGFFAGTCQTTYCQRTGLPCIGGYPCCGICAG